MTQHMMSTLRTAAVALALAGFAHVSQAAEPVLDAAAIEKLSASAATPAEHERAARQYRLRAESLESKAEKHETEARRVSEGHNPMATKWPAVGRATEDRERRLAMQARRAAEECYARAERHVQLAAKASGGGSSDSSGQH